MMIDVDLQTTADIFQEIVSSRSGMPFEKFALYFQSKPIEGEATLCSYGICKDANIEVKFRGRGGVGDTRGDDRAAHGARGSKPLPNRICPNELFNDNPTTRHQLSVNPLAWGMTLRQFNEFIKACRGTQTWEAVKRWDTHEPDKSHRDQTKHVWDSQNKKLKYVPSVTADDLNEYFIK